MSEKRFTLDIDDEVIIVVDNANEEWKGHILNIVDKLNELNDERMMYKTTIDKRIVELKEENKELKKENEELNISINLFEADIIEKDNKIKQLQQQLDFIQNNISNAIQHQKTELEQKALKRVISDYNDYLLGHNGEYE